MKKSLVIILVMVLTICTCFKISDTVDSKIEAVYSTMSQEKTIIIDAGHGGIDCGTVGIDGALEKTINLSIAQILYNYFSVAGLKCTLVRKGDYELRKAGEKREKSDLYNRLEYVNSFKNSVLISIHQNHYENESEKGSQIWYSTNDELSKTLANSILEMIKSNLQPENSRINKPSGDDYYILFKAINPSIMIECGFMSNNEENTLLQDEEYQKDFSINVLVGAIKEI